eukprot:Em0014g230a
MCRIFHDATTEAALLVDADNTFNSLNLRNNQGDPLAMAMYAIATIPLIEKLQSTNTKQVWYADDATAVGTLLNLKAWWTMLSSSGTSYGYFVNPGKTWLIVQPQHECDAKELFSGTGIGINLKGSTILTQPHAAYCAFVHGVSGLWTLFLRTIPDISSLLQPLEDAIRLNFIPSITGRDSISDTKRDLFALPARLGGLAIPNPTCMDLPHSTFVDQKQAKATVHSLRQQLHSSELVRLKAILPPAHVRSMDLNSEKGASIQNQCN